MFTTKKLFAALLIAPLFIGCTVEDGDDDDAAGTETDPTAATMTDATMTMTDATMTTMTDPSVTDTDPTTVTDTDPTTVTDTDPTTVTDTDPTADTGSTGETDTGGGGMFCQATCVEAADCCPEGLPDCPGDYPLNYECNGGLCESGGCADDTDCELIMGTSCLEVNAFPLCVPVCESDDDCLTDFGETCSGMADSGEMICTVEPVPCKADADCFDFGLCNVETGACECADAAECPKGYDCVGG